MIPGRLIALATLLTGATPALAAPLTCATVGGTTYTAPVNLAVTLKTGEALTISTPDAATLAVSIEFGGRGGTDDSICNPAFDGTSCDGFSHTAQRDGNYGVQAFNAPGDSFTLACGAGGGGTGGGASGGLPAAQGAGAFVSATSSVGFVGGAIDSTLRDNTPASVTRNGLFLSTVGGDAGLTGWASVQGRFFDGDIDGSARELTFGMDFEAGAATRLGLFLSLGRSDLDVGGTDVDSDAVSFGPYFKTTIGDRYTFTGFALFARPDYDVGGTSYSADRRAAGLTANADYTWGRAAIRSHIGVTAFAEDHPAAGPLAGREVRGLTGSIGTRAALATGTPLTPYISLGADFTRYDDGLGDRSSHASPRLGTGFTYDSGNGRLTLDIDGGEVLDDTRDLKLRMNYNLNF